MKELLCRGATLAEALRLPYAHRIANWPLILGVRFRDVHEHKVRYLAKPRVHVGEGWHKAAERGSRERPSDDDERARVAAAVRKQRDVVRAVERRETAVGGGVPDDE